MRDKRIVSIGLDPNRPNLAVQRDKRTGLSGGLGWGPCSAK